MLWDFSIMVGISASQLTNMASQLDIPCNVKRVHYPTVTAHNSTKTAPFPTWMACCHECMIHCQTWIDQCYAGTKCYRTYPMSRFTAYMCYCTVKIYCCNDNVHCYTGKVCCHTWLAISTPSLKIKWRRRLPKNLSSMSSVPSRKARCTLDSRKGVNLKRTCKIK